MDDKVFMKDLSVPQSCEECGGALDYQGLGGYKCKECGHMMFDDYGKVREYLDSHSGATISGISSATKVPTGKIREMVREDRFETTANSAISFTCDKCGAPIRSGRVCETCRKLMAASKNLQRSSNAAPTKNIQGFSSETGPSQGERRFNRN